LPVSSVADSSEAQPAVGTDRAATEAVTGMNPTGDDGRQR
jgi:hypothetical protein